MKIGNIQLDNNIFLAPMAGVTDLPFRLLCKEQGCGLVYTEMVSAKGLMYKNKNTEILLTTDKKESPVALQLFGSDPIILSEVAKEIEKRPVDIIDINMGCPVPKIVNNNEGSALMKNPELVGEIVRHVSSVIGKPVTVKIRKGFTNENSNAVQIANIAEENGAAAITVHGRTREQYYSGKADWDIIKEVKKSVSIPVIGNGDVSTPQEARSMLEYTDCDAIMVGRAAKGNPWLFKRIITYLENGIIIPEPTAEEIVETIIRHFEMLIELKGEYTAIMEMRKHIGWYTKGLNNSTKLRKEINEIITYENLKQRLYEFILENK